MAQTRSKPKKAAADEPVLVRATAKYVRVSPRKVRLVADQVRGTQIVHEIRVDEGPTLKRFRPRAMGRATPIHKRTCHITVVLTPEDEE